jgi:hypothetical protein
VSAATPAGEGSMKTIYGDWQDRRKRARSVRYEIVGEVTSLKGCFSTIFKGAPGVSDIIRHLGDVPPRDITNPWAISFTADFSRGKVRIDRREHLLVWDNKEFEKTGFRLNVTANIFDGNAAKTLRKDPDGSGRDEAGMVMPDASSRLVLQETAAADTIYVRVQELPILLGHGYIPTAPNVSLSSLFRSDTFSDLIPAGTAAIGDIECTVLRSKPTSGKSAVFREYWVDPSRDSAIVRSRTISQDCLLDTVDIHYEKTALGWLPQSWVCYEYLAKTKGDISQRFQFTVKNRVLEPELDSQTFDVPLVPGMLVVDERNSAYSLSRVNKDGRLSKVGNPYTPAPMSEKPRFIRYCLVCFFGLLCAVLATMRIWRRKRLHNT